MSAGVVNDGYEVGRWAAVLAEIEQVFTLVSGGAGAESLDVHERCKLVEGYFMALPSIRGRGLLHDDGVAFGDGVIDHDLPGTEGGARQVAVGAGARGVVSGVVQSSVGSDVHAAGVSLGGASAVSREVGTTRVPVVPGMIPRGPNYLRNRAARFRKKVQRDERRLAEAEARGRLSVSGGARGFFSGCDQAVQDNLRESRARLLLLENERKAIEERARIAKLKSPMAHAEAVVSAIRVREFCEKREANRVAKWAGSVAASAAVESARSAPSSVLSLESFSDGLSASSLKTRYSVEKLKKSQVEEKVIALGMLTTSGLVSARIKAGRRLVLEDFFSPGAPKSTADQKRALIGAIVDVRIFDSQNYAYDCY